MESPSQGIYSRKNRLNTPVRLTRNRNSELVEFEVDRRIRSKSPFFNGKKNDSFIAPHFKSQIVLGSDKQNESSKITPFLKKTADYDICKITQKRVEKSLYEENVNKTNNSRNYDSNNDVNFRKTNPFQNNQYNQLQQDEKRKNTINSNVEKPIYTNSGNNSQRGKNYSNAIMKNNLNKPVQYEITMKEEAIHKNSESNENKPKKTESNKLTDQNKRIDTNNNRKDTMSHKTTEKNSDELVCDMCYNKEMLEEKGNNKYQLETDDNPLNLSIFNDKMNRERFKLINQRIKNREKLSEIVSNSFRQLDDKQKEKFIQKNLEEKSLIGELGYRLDPTMEKVRNSYLDKEYLRQNYLRKYIFNEKPTVKEFYDKYVENYVPEEKNDLVVDRFPNYKQELLDQIQQKQADDLNFKMKEKQSSIEQILKNQQLLDDDANRRIENAKRLKEEFQIHNKSMEDEKRRNKENMILDNKREELENLKKLNNELIREEEDLRLKKDENLAKVREDLMKQIGEKKLQREKDEILEKIANNEVKNPFVFTCQHGSSLVPCSQCNKSYPKNLLSKRSKSQNLIGKKKEAKVK